MNTFGIIIVSGGFGIYGLYITCCVYDIGRIFCSKIYNSIKNFFSNIKWCKSSLPLDQDITLTLNEELVKPLTVNEEVKFIKEDEGLNNIMIIS